MIRINLLPEEFRRSERTSPRVFAATLMSVIAVCSAAGWFGFEGIVAEARLAEPAGILVAPHNWGSLIGFYMQLHVGRAVKNFYRAEHDPLSNPALIAEGFELRDGTCRVPERPGCGLKLDEKRLPDHARRLFELKAA